MKLNSNTMPNVANNTDLDNLRQELAQINTLTYELDELQALVDVSRQAVKEVAALETESAVTVLGLVVNRLFVLNEQQKARAAELEALICGVEA